MAKLQKAESGSKSPTNSSRLLFGSRRLSHSSILADKENSSSLPSAYTMEYSLTLDNDVSPSKVNILVATIIYKYKIYTQT